MACSDIGRRRQRRAGRGAVAVLVVAALAPACGDDAVVAAGADLVVLWPRDAQDLDPRFVGDAYGHKLSRLLFGSLVTIDPHALDVVPDLAERVEVTDATSYRVTLRPGLRFSDGSALDAADVVATFESVVDPEVGSRYAATYRRIERVEALDARTLLFRLREPHATFLTDLELPVLRSEDARRHLGAEGSVPVSSGPYVLEARVNGRIDLAPNPHWVGGVPRFGHVRIVVVRDDNTRALRLLAGAGDLAMSAVPPLLVPLFERDPRFEVRSVPGTGTTYLGIHLRAGRLADVRVRKALAHAIDREALVRSKLGGRARLARSWVAPGHWAHSEAVPMYRYDPARARALLDEAGLHARGDGLRLTLTLRCGNERSTQSNARALAAMLREVGVEVEVRPSDVATLLADLNRGRFELTLLQLPELVEPHVLSWFFASHHIPEGGAEGSNRWRLRSAGLDAALERGRSTTDRPARVQAYLEAQQILAQELPVIPLWHEDVVAVIGERARAFAVPRDGRYGTLAR